MAFQIGPGLYRPCIHRSPRPAEGDRETTVWYDVAGSVNFPVLVVWHGLLCVSWWRTGSISQSAPSRASDLALTELLDAESTFITDVRGVEERAPSQWFFSARALIPQRS